MEPINPDQTYDIVDSEGTLVEEAAPQPETVLPKLTRGEIGKLRKQYITVQHPRVIGCKHRLDLKRQPTHRNCHKCWFAWFQNNKEVVATADEVFKNGHFELIVKLQGHKFYNYFTRFMGTVERLQQMQEQQRQQGQQEQQTEQVSQESNG